LIKEDLSISRMTWPFFVEDDVADHGSEDYGFFHSPAFLLQTSLNPETEHT